MKKKLKWSKQQKRNKIFFIPEFWSGSDEKDCEQEECWEMLINKLELWSGRKGGFWRCCGTRLPADQKSELCSKWSKGTAFQREFLLLGKAGLDMVSPEQGMEEFSALPLSCHLDFQQCHDLNPFWNLLQLEIFTALLSCFCNHLSSALTYKIWILFKQH